MQECVQGAGHSIRLGAGHRSAYRVQDTVYELTQNTGHSWVQVTGCRSAYRVQDTGHMAGCGAQESVS